MLFEAIEIEKKMKDEEEMISTENIYGKHQNQMKKKNDGNEGKSQKVHKFQKKEKYVNIKRAELLKEEVGMNEDIIQPRNGKKQVFANFSSSSSSDEEESDSDEGVEDQGRQNEGTVETEQIKGKIEEAEDKQV